MQDAIERIDDMEMAAKVPPALDWEWSVPAINAWLRAAFESTRSLGPDLMPVRAEPLVPEWFDHNG